MPTKTQVRGRGAIAVAAQATTENKLKVTAIEMRPAKKRSSAHRHPCTQRAAVAATSATPLADISSLGTVTSRLCGTAGAWESSYDAFAVVTIRMSALRLSAAIRPSMP